MVGLLGGRSIPSILEDCLPCFPRPSGISTKATTGLDSKFRPAIADVNVFSEKHGEGEPVFGILLLSRRRDIPTEFSSLLSHVAPAAVIDAIARANQVLFLEASNVEAIACLAANHFYAGAQILRRNVHGTYFMRRPKVLGERAWQSCLQAQKASHGMHSYLQISRRLPSAFIGGCYRWGLTPPRSGRT